VSSFLSMRVRVLFLTLLSAETFIFTCMRDRERRFCLFLINDTIPNHSIKTLFVYYRSSHFQLTSWEGVGTDLEVDDRAGKLSHLSQPASDQLASGPATPGWTQADPNKCPRVYHSLVQSPTQPPLEAKVA
jgi:hypothetical protein